MRLGKKKGFKKGGKGKSVQTALNITAMADIFTIILVFLIKSFTSGSVNLTPSPGLLMPDAQAATADVEALKLEVSNSAVLVENIPAAALKEFRFDGKDLEKSGASRSLMSALEKERKRQMIIAQANPDVKVNSKILIVADKRVPYATIKSVLASAAVNGFTDFKLAVVRHE